jgi:uncharacterized protein YegP (UPF0339 family)
MLIFNSPGRSRMKGVANVAWKFVVAKTNSGKSSWWLYGGNGEMTAWAGQEFASDSGANVAATAFKKGAADARYEVYEDAGGSWRWRAWRSSDKVAASGESFASKYNAERAADGVKENAPSASSS